MPVTLRVSRFASLLTALGLVSAGTLMGCTPTQHQTASAPDVAAAVTPLPTDPDTVVLRMGEYLKTLNAFTLSPDISYDQTLPSGPKIQFLSSAVISVRRPDRLRADVTDDDGERSIIYDGKSLTVYGKTRNLYATVDAPPTLDAMFDTVLHKYDLGLPLVDILYRSVHGTLLDEVQTGVVVGRSRVRGVECDHVAYHQDDVDWQLWVEASATPFPRRIVITTLGEPGQPQYEADLKWNLSPTFDDSLFAFTPPRDAGRIKLATLNTATEPATATAGQK